jgi:hypothetical protein
MFQAWQTKIQVEMVAWKKVHRFKRSIGKQEFLVVKFKKVWTHGGLLCKDIRTFQWQIVPN